MLDSKIEENIMKITSFIGAGNMAFAMASALHNNNKTVSVGLFDVDHSRVDLFRGSFTNVKDFDSIEDLERESDIIIIAVKPQVIDTVLEKLKESQKIIVSIAAGITMDHLTEKMPYAYISRVMPNTPSLVGRMAAGVSFSSGMDMDKKDDVFEFLSHSGMAIEVLETQMDAVTGISGSGPAFVARIMKHFIDAGIKHGLEPEISRNLTLNTFLGTAKLIIDKDMDIEDLIKMVSSPGGTTVAGRAILESSKIEGIIQNTVDATVKRSKELGRLC